MTYSSAPSPGKVLSKPANYHPEILDNNQQLSGFSSHIKPGAKQAFGSDPRSMVNENQSLFRACKALMFYGGMWQGNLPNWSIARQKLYKVLSKGVQFFYFFCLPSLVLSLWSNVGEDNETAVNIMKNMTFVVVIFCKIIVIQSSRVTRLLEAATKEEHQVVLTSDPQILEIHRRQVIYTDLVVKSIAAVTFLAGLAYVIANYYLVNEFYKLYPDTTPTDPKPHGINFWFPFNKDVYYKTTFMYEILHIAQTVIYNGATHGVVNSVLVFLKTEFKILQHNIKHMKSKENWINSCSAQVLKTHVRKHQELINWANEFNCSFEYIILLEYSVISLTLASTLIDIMQGIKVVFNGIFFLLTTQQLFTLSWNANEIVLASSSDLSDALYSCSWNELDKESQGLVLFMMLKCKKPLQISNGPFGFLTLEGAVSRIKLAYSVVSVLSR